MKLVGKVSAVETTTPQIDAAAGEKGSPPGVLQSGLDWVKSVDWRAVTRHPLFLPTLITTILFFALFWKFIKYSVVQWERNDYYSHGFLVPLLVIWQLKIRGSDFKSHVPRSWAPALVVVPFLAYTAYVAIVADVWAIQSLVFVGILLFSVLYLFGWRWFLLSASSILFLLFSLPVWDSFINSYTNPLQIASTYMANAYLKLFGFDTHMANATEINLNHYSLTVAVPCSGLKLLVAVACFTAHFILIARKEMLFNLLMVALILPLCLMINGLRIALIGVVGELHSDAAAASFHDYSGYITLVLCFFILFKFARIFGWKD